MEFSDNPFFFCVVFGLTFGAYFLVIACCLVSLLGLQYGSGYLLRCLRERALMAVLGLNPPPAEMCQRQEEKGREP